MPLTKEDTMYITEAQMRRTKAENFSGSRVHMQDALKREDSNYDEKEPSTWPLITFAQVADCSCFGIRYHRLPSGAHYDTAVMQAFDDHYWDRVSVNVFVDYPASYTMEGKRKDFPHMTTAEYTTWLEKKKRLEKHEAKLAANRAKAKLKRDTKKKLDEEAKKDAGNAKKKLDDEAKKKLDDEAKRILDDEARRKSEDEAKKKLDAAAKKNAGIAKKRLDDEAKKRSENEPKNKLEDEDKKRGDGVGVDPTETGATTSKDGLALLGKTESELKAQYHQISKRLVEAREMDRVITENAVLRAEKKKLLEVGMQNEKLSETVGVLRAENKMLSELGAQNEKLSETIGALKARLTFQQEQMDDLMALSVGYGEKFEPQAESADHGTLRTSSLNSPPVTPASDGDTQKNERKKRTLLDPDTPDPTPKKKQAQGQELQA
jgi:hypothetical protein